MRIGLIKALGTLAVVTLFSCKTASVVTNKEVTNQNDTNTSTNTKVHVQDSIYAKPATNQTIEITLDTTAKKSDVKHVVSTGGDTLSLEIKGNKIIAKSNCDALISRHTREIYTKDSTISALQNKKHFEVTHETIVKERVVPPWWVKPLFIVMAVLILGLLGYIAFLRIWK